MIERLAAGAALKKSAGNVHHVRRACAFVEQRCAAASAEAARRSRSLVFIAHDLACALRYSKSLAPTADVGGVSRTVYTSACRRMVMPGPARGVVDFEMNGAAETFCRDTTK